MIKKLLLFVVMLTTLALPISALAAGGGNTLNANNLTTNQTTSARAAVQYTLRPQSIIPENNKKVENITASTGIVLVFESEPQLNIEQIDVTKNGAYICKANLIYVYDYRYEQTAGVWDWVGLGETIEIKPTQDLTDDGTYVFTIPQGAISTYDWSLDLRIYNPEMVLTYTIGDVTQPTVENLTFTDNPSDCAVGQSCTFTVSPNLLAEGFSYTVTDKTSGSIVTDAVSVTQNNAVYTLIASKAGEYTIKITGKTAGGNNAEGSFDITVTEPQIPDSAIKFPGLSDNTLNIVAGIQPGFLTIEPEPKGDIYDFEFTPANNDNITYSYDFDHTYRFNAKRAGNWSVKVYEKGSDHSEVLGTFKINVTAAPISYNLSTQSPKVEEAFDLTFSTEVDANGYTIVVNPSLGVEIIKKDNNSYQITIANPDTYTFKITGTSPEGYDLEREFIETVVADGNDLKVIGQWDVMEDLFPDAVGVLSIGDRTFFQTEPYLNQMSLEIQPDNGGLVYEDIYGWLYLNGKKEGKYTLTVSGNDYLSNPYKKKFTIAVVSREKVDIDFIADYIEEGATDVKFNVSPNKSEFNDLFVVKNENGYATNDVELNYSESEGYYITPNKVGNYIIELEYLDGFKLYTCKKTFEVERKFPENSIEPLNHKNNNGYTIAYGHDMSNYTIEDFADHTKVKEVSVEAILDPEWKAKYEWKDDIHGISDDSHSLYHGIYVGIPEAFVNSNDELILKANVPGEYKITVTSIHDKEYNYDVKILPTIHPDTHTFAFKHAIDVNGTHYFEMNEEEQKVVQFWAPHWGTVYCYIKRDENQKNSYQPQGIQLVNINSEGNPLTSNGDVMEQVKGNTLDLTNAKEIYLVQKVNGLMTEEYHTNVNITNVPTGIDEVGVADGETVGKYYTLEGIEVSEPQSGHIYIHVTKGKSTLFIAK